MYKESEGSARYHKSRSVPQKQRPGMLSQEPQRAAVTAPSLFCVRFCRNLDSVRPPTCARRKLHYPTFTDYLSKNLFNAFTGYILHLSIFVFTPFTSYIRHYIICLVVFLLLQTFHCMPLSPIVGYIITPCQPNLSSSIVNAAT